MTTEIRRFGAAVLLGFFALAVGLAYWQVVRSEELNTRPDNPRLIEESLRTLRGTIFAADGTVLAETTPDGRRLYHDPSLAQTIGYMSVRFGVSGLEQAYHEYLVGEKGVDPLTALVNEVVGRPAQGNDLVLTIRPEVQQAAAEALGGRPGAVVALDPRTGAVLAMVSAPGYDPNTLDEEGEALLTDPAEPLLNRATQGLYTPGSTYKTVTAAAALDSGYATPSSRFECRQPYVVQGFRIECRNLPPGLTQYDFVRAYAYSVNATFAQIAVDLGAATWVEYSRRFGMGSALPFDIPTAETQISASPLDPVLLANSGFGQGELLVTPLQMALVVAAVANGGELPRPYLVQEIRSPEGRVLEVHRTEMLRRVMGEQAAADLLAMMETAVNEGFGQQARVPGVRVGGKTGTAETGRRDAAGNMISHAWFTAVAPVDDPQVAVAVIVEDAGQGSVVAAPIAREVMAAALGR
ncbi:MAG TPA: penicillin-binding transpeptidase domain-containing protein [Dehalococcoidia bacterium]